jgi:hypothetical protein
MQPGITLELLQEYFDYDSESGRLTWKHRNRSRFKDDRAWNTWNTRYAGKEAGAVKHEYNTSYRQIKVSGDGIHRLSVPAHQIAFAVFSGRLPLGIIDHIDGDGLNNRADNLREATAAINARNKAILAKNSSGVHGVSMRKNGKWLAVGTLNRIHSTLGLFETLFDAAAARKSWENKNGFHPNHGRTTPKKMAIPNINQHHVAEAFWETWRDVYESGRHGHYESTWMALKAALTAALPAYSEIQK